MRQEWFTPAEVTVHNTLNDCWVSLRGKVLNLTKWLEEQRRLCTCLTTCTCEVKNWYCSNECVEKCKCFKRGYFYCDGKRLAATIRAFAGKDISHWFNGDDWVMYTHPITGAQIPFMRHGPDSLHPIVPSTKWRPYHRPWWLNPDYVVGKLTEKTRPIRITNTITGATVTLEVCSEETIYQIMLRYYPHNTHMNSYTWRYMGRHVCLHKTLEQNGILDERERFTAHSLPENIHVPAILLYFNDDLTEDLSNDLTCFCEDRDCKRKHINRDEDYEHVF